MNLYYSAGENISNLARNYGGQRKKRRRYKSPPRGRMEIWKWMNQDVCENIPDYKMRNITSENTDIYIDVRILRKTNSLIIWNFQIGHMES